MSATQILRQEHEAILKMLDAAETAARRLQGGGAVGPDTLSGIVEFFQVFADRCHHGKEEDLLFPALVAHGMPRDGGPVGVMLHEHDLGRARVREMAEAAREAAGGDPSAGSRWATAAMVFAELLRAHIAKENNILFVMADRILTPSEQIEMVQAFDRVEMEKLGEGTHERLHASMEIICGELLGASARR